MHLPIPTGATWGCWGVSNHERRPAWPPVTAPTEKKTAGSCLCISAWLVVKRCFSKNIMKKKHNSELTIWRVKIFPEVPQLFEFSYLWVFFVQKRVVVSSGHQETSGDVKEEVGVLFWLANRIKCLLKILGMDPEKGEIFQHFFWTCCSWNFEWEVVFSIGCHGLQSLWRHSGGRLPF